MKKICLFLAVMTAAMLMTGCKGSAAQAESTRETTKFETQPYSIPEGASGPADVKIESSLNDLPEDKRSESDDNVIQVRYFYINSKGLNEDFDVIRNGVADAAAMNDLLIRGGVVVDGTEVVSFDSDGTNGTLTLNEMEGMSSYATEELLAQAIANTYTDNLGLETLTIKVGDKTYGPLKYDDLKKK